VQFCGAHKSEILGIKEQDHVLSAELGQGEVVYDFLAVDYGFGVKIRGLLAYQNTHGCLF
jgi:hypothetical protein